VVGPALGAPAPLLSGEGLRTVEVAEVASGSVASD